MSDEQNMQGEKYLVLATFNGELKAEEVLGVLEEYTAQISPFRDEAVVIAVDEKGKVSVHGGKKSKKGLVSGSLVGVLVGALVGFPVIGILLGGALGVHRGKKKTKQKIEGNVDADVLQSILNYLQPNSSLIVAEVEDWQAQNIADSLQSYGATHVLLGNADDVAAQISASDQAESITVDGDDGEDGDTAV